MNTHETTLATTLATLIALAMPAVAKETDCRTTSVPLNEIDTFDRSFRGVSIDGGGGVDTFALKGPVHLALRPKRYRSMERIDVRNGLFDTIFVDAGFLATAQDGQVELVTDPFDQVFADPLADWGLMASETSVEQVLTTSPNGVELSVRTDLDTFIVLPSETPLEAAAGPEGDFQLLSQAGIAAPPVLLNNRLAWEGPGVVLPDLSLIVPGALTLDTRNGQHNVIGIDLALLASDVSRTLNLEADATDRVVLLEPDCWTADEDTDTGETILRGPPGTSVTLSADATLLLPSRLGSVVTAVADVPGYRHISADLSAVVDEIDLRNGGRDVIVLRNTALRHDIPVVIAGDAGLDEVWVEGSAGWRIGHGAFGTTVTTPAQTEAYIILGVSPGLGLRLLPTPSFLTDPDMAEVPFYPGIRDEPSEAEGVFFTRGGIVRLSLRQLEGKTRLISRNGIANDIHLDLSEPLNGLDFIDLLGDARLDRLVIQGGPRHEVEEDGILVWRVPRDGGGEQEIRATGFVHAVHPN